MGFGSHSLIYTIRVIVESGLMYTLAAIALFVTTLLNSPSVSIVGGCRGITFNLIIIRFDNNLADRSTVSAQSNTRSIPLGSLPHNE
ncbi:hypothetical protein OBBRIDRAFT_832190 [Obba rivulosa]|uniref:Uncharacterized protein n=1 Tax=Obba rivulosa TaxID=1052685 RepID=A0A8E2J3S7_9APHY|nr:hypothetical protein OBBRIDRAFT_832190 [Obba rivulosa]